MQTERGLDSPPEQQLHTSKTCAVMEFFLFTPALLSGTVFFFLSNR